MKIARTFSGFRKQLASALRKAEAPEELCREVGFVEEEGAVAEAVFGFWDEIEREMSEFQRDPSRYGGLPKNFTEAEKKEQEEALYEDVCYSSVHDAVIEAVVAYQNPWNYAPGHRAQPIADIGKLAKDTVEIFLYGDVLKPKFKGKAKTKRK